MSERFISLFPFPVQLIGYTSCIRTASLPSFVITLVLDSKVAFDHALFAANYYNTHVTTQFSIYFTKINYIIFMYNMHVFKTGIYTTFVKSIAYISARAYIHVHINTFYK